MTGARDVRVVSQSDGGMHGKDYNRLYGRKGHHSRGKGPSKAQESVHKRNLNVVAQPVIFVFNVIRLIAFYLWVVLSAVCQTVARGTSSSQQSGSELKHGTADSGNTADYGAYSRYHSDEVCRLPPPGPGEPALAKQKHHHRKAFEYISKALKLDEENRNAGKKNQIY